MTRARNITVLGGMLFASISLTNLRADVTSAPIAAIEYGEDAFFPDDVAAPTYAEQWNIRLLQHEAGAEPTPVPPPPNPSAQSAPNVPESGSYPPGDQYGNGPGPGPGWAPPFWPAGSGCGPGYGPGYGPGCGPSCGPDCNSCCGMGCDPGCGSGCGQGGPVVIQNGWGDVWNNWLCCCPGGLVAGVEGTFLAPVDEPTQRVVLTDLLTDRQWSGDPHGSLGAGVRTWVGLQKCGWGVRFRYWHFGNDNIDVDPDVPVFAQPTIHDSYHLEANVLDFELTQRFCLHCWQIDTSFGARYADLERYMQSVGFGRVGNGVDLYGLAMGANELNGTGFTGSIGGLRRISPCANWFWFWNFRGSVLWADTTASVLTDATAFTGAPPGSANARNFANASEDSENVWIADTQAGIEYRICPCRCRGQLAFRGGVEFQHWDTGDLFAQSQSFAFLQGGAPDFGGESFAAADAHDGDLDLIGFILGVEWTY